MIGNVNYVTLSYCPDHQTISIRRPTYTGRIDNVRPYGRAKRLRVIRARFLLRHFNVTIPETLVFTGLSVMYQGPFPVLNLQITTAVPLGKIGAEC